MMAASSCAAGILARPSPALLQRSKKSMSGDFTYLAQFSTGSARWPTGGAVYEVGCGPGFLSPMMGLSCGRRQGRTLRKRAGFSGKKQVEGFDQPGDRSTWCSSSSPSASLREESSRNQGDGGDGSYGRGGHGGGGGGGGGNNGSGGSEESGESAEGGGILGSFIRGWNARVRADPQFAFKVLMEEIIGVGMCVLGDMATRPNFGLGELDLVFSTLIVGAILNFTLMYMLAPTASVGIVASKLPGIFSSSPAGHMFEPGSYSLLERFGTFVWKGAQFAAVGFFAGLVGTGLSSALISGRKKVDPNFVAQNASPPVLLNAATWAAHMGFSSNARYQSLNGLEFALAQALSPGAFKICVPVLRGLNNILGGTTFVSLARLTGSQPKGPSSPPESPLSEETPLEPAGAQT